MENILSQLTNLHDTLCDTVNYVENYFGHNIVLIVGSLFFSIIFNCYYVLEVLFGPDEMFKSLDDTELLVVFMATVIASAMQLFAFIEISNKTVRQNNNISMNIHKLLNVSESKEVKERLRYFALQWQNRRIRFTAAGVFNLDRTLYLTVSFWCIFWKKIPFVFLFAYDYAMGVTIYSGTRRWGLPKYYILT